jgi:hypothetical protein
MPLEYQIGTNVNSLSIEDK